MFSRARSGRSYGAALRDLTAESADVRASAAEHLARHVDEHRAEVMQALMDALADDSATVRAAAALGLADIGASEAVSALIGAVDDGHDHVRQMALAALGEIGDVRALQAIHKTLHDDEPAIRFQAVMAFSRVCNDTGRAVQVLLDATRDDDALVRHIALRMAEEIADDDSVVDNRVAQRAVAMLIDESPIVQVAAAVILARGGRREGVHILVSVAKREVITNESDDEGAALELCGTLQLREAIDGLEVRAFKRVILVQHDPFAWQARVALAAMKHPRAVQWVVSELTAWTRERRCLAVAAARLANVVEAKTALQSMRGDESRADPDEIASALKALS